ncbi:MAG: GNAT family N-acetyltransferase [Gammaproteobacteria bacterium]|nr:GNAT family N-acetyltransferase [Gammaproteobacteria bacterium]
MPVKILLRPAEKDDIKPIVAMLADDKLGRQRENYIQPLPKEYFLAWQEIKEDVNNELVVACAEKVIVGVLQITFIPNLTYQGSKRAQIEGVRVHKAYRSKGVGKQLFEWAIHRARENNCRLVQLTTNKSRAEAKSFYESLGFVASHDGMKLDLAP